MAVLSSILMLTMLQPAPRADIRVDVDLVNVTFTVRDKTGALQPSLRKEDFTVLEDGVAQQVRFFSQEFDLPLALGIVLDLSGSQSGLERKNVALATDFLRSVLQPSDTVFVAAFRGRIKLVQDFTSSSAEIEDALDHAQVRLGTSPNLGPRRLGGASPVRDAMYFCARDKLKTVTGRKALIFISDGEDNASRKALGDTIEMLQSADTILYALNPGVGTQGKIMRVLAPHMALLMRSHMDRIATEAGGQEFKVSQLNLQETFRRIEEELRTLYVIGYVSSNTNRDGKWRKIQIRPNRADLVVRARQGYRARKG